MLITIIMEMNLSVIQHTWTSQIHHIRAALISGNCCRFLPLTPGLLGSPGRHNHIFRGILLMFASKEDSPRMTLMNVKQDQIWESLLQTVECWADVREGGYDSLSSLWPLTEPRNSSSPVLCRTEDKTTQIRPPA